MRTQRKGLYPPASMEQFTQEADLGAPWQRWYTPQFPFAQEGVRLKEPNQVLGGGLFGFCFCHYFLVFETVSLCSPYVPGTHPVVQAGLKLTIILLP